jgi:hypothetical protein
LLFLLLQHQKTCSTRWKLPIQRPLDLIGKSIHAAFPERKSYMRLMVARELAMALKAAATTKKVRKEWDGLFHGAMDPPNLPSLGFRCPRFRFFPSPMLGSASGGYAALELLVSMVTMISNPD